MKSNLNSVLERFSSIRILSVGDIMIDRFLQGKVERISPEAPVPVFQFVNEKKMLGGAGNVVANLSALECKVFFTGLVGSDDFGDDVAKLLDSLKADHYLLKRTDYPTIMKARFIAGNNHILRFDKENIKPLDDKEEEQLLIHIEQQIPNCDIVLLSDYAKGLLNEQLTPEIIAMAKRYNKRVLIDPKGNDYSKYKGAFLVKPNRKELEQISGQTLDVSAADFLERVINAARYVLKKYSIENMIITLSEKGMLYVSSDLNTEQIYLPTSAKEVFDVSGAGDTSLATLGAALAADATIKDAMELANLAAGIVVGKLGTATVTHSELTDILQNH